ncbi:hypothetical protein [Streptomyces sp. NPDC000410]|uniref:hypothetical protein n=1 Tax=Streptomyces sp. NPDC000410 TaxID=3154254 RepID=UPI0033320078
MPEHVHITPLHRVSVTDTAAWHQVVAASMAHDLPGVPPLAPARSTPSSPSRGWTATG